MKKVSFLVVVGCLFFATMSVNAQTEFKPFRVDLGLGWAVPSNGGGLVFNLEPKYAVIPQLSVGLKLEMDAIAKDLKIDSSGELAEGIAQGIVSILATADYHLLKNKFRPFVGGGIGLYSIAAGDLNTTVDVEAANNFGPMLRAGFDVSHFRLALAYSFAGKDNLKNNSNFFSITVGAYIGGGRRK